MSFDNGDILVDVGLITWPIKSGTLEGVTLSIMINAGSRKHLVAVSSSDSECGIGILDAESISFLYSTVSVQAP